MDLPHFPRELEREILEIAAERWSHEVPKLLLVAHRVHLWLEPFLYRSIRLGFPYGGDPSDTMPAQEAFLRMASLKPPSFLAQAVRHVNIDFGDEYCQPEFVLRFIEAPKHCNGITHFTMNNSDQQVGEKFNVVSLAHLRHLCAFLRDLMPYPVPMNAFLPAFRSLTHLTVLELDPETDPRCLPFLKTLPALTHLALRGDVEADIWSPLLHRNACVHLQIFVLLLIREIGDPEWQMHEQWANAVGRSVQDPRVVFTLLRVSCISSHAPPDDRYWTGDFSLNEKPEPEPASALAGDGEDYPSGFKLVLLITALCLAVFLVALDNTIMASPHPSYKGPV
ncbi:hypothetical protein C8F01DRAFT_1295710 [Mycena amicta]|nr:hypothetical protein C8F01DRAFT_1295710 [Mycena amicta]